MADFNGTKYRKIHPSAFGPGQPLSTAKHHFIKNNNIHNFERGSAVALPLLTASSTLVGGTGDRPHTSLDWTTIFVAPVSVGQRLDRVRVSGVIRVSDNDSSKAYPLSYHLRLVAFGRVSDLTVPYTDNRYVPFEIEVSGINSKTLHEQIELWGRGEPGGTFAHGIDDEYHEKFRDTLTATISAGTSHLNVPYIDATGPQPDESKNCLDLMFTLVDEMDEAGYDHVKSDSFESGGLVYRSTMAINPSIEGFINTRPRTAFLGYAQFKGLLIETGYRSKGLYDEGELRPNIVERGEVAQKHNQITVDAYSRPKSISFGHGGVPNNRESTWPTGYRQNWLYADSGAGDVTLFECPAVIDCAGRLTVDALFIGCFFHPSGFLTGNDGIFNDDNRIKGEWSVTARALQYQAGSASAVEVGSGTILKEVSHYRAVRDPGASPFLQQMFWARYQDPSTTYAWIYREGQLAKPDMRLVERVSIDIYPDAMLDLSTPIMIQLTVKQVGSVSPKATDGYRLVLVGNSIHLHPAPVKS